MISPIALLLLICSAFNDVLYLRRLGPVQGCSMKSQSKPHHSVAK
jgi:hypothetical protein